MNTTWQQPELELLENVQKLLAQAPTDTSNFNQGVAGVQGIIQPLLQFIPHLLGSAAILLVGWLVAAIAAKLTRDLLNRTNIDNRIASGVSGNQNVPQVEKLISDVVFWSIILLTVVAVLQTLGLEVASRPLNSFLDQLIGFLPKVVGAGVIFALAWFLATIIKVVTVRSLRAFKLDERLHQEVQDSSSANISQLSLSETIGNALYWFIFLLFLAPVLDSLGLKEALQPVQALTTQILSILPNILASILIGTVGWFLANIVRRIVTNLLTTTGIDNLGGRVGLAPSPGVQSLSTIIGTIVYVLILIPVAIAALNALKIEAISTPAIGMLQQVLNTLPSIFTAAGIIAIAYFFAKFAADIVTSILTSLGFNNIFSILGLPVPQTYTVTIEPAQPVIRTRTPSEIAGIIVMVGIMLFATVAAVNILNIPALTTLVSGIVIILGRILAGLVVFAIGLFLANLAFNLISSSDNSQSRFLAQVARIAIIALVSAMALQQIGVAPDIVNLAFGLLFGAISVAIALAFGLGARDVAQEQVREWLTSFKNKD